MQITGTIIDLLPLKSGTSARGSAWRKQEFIVQTHEDYPKKICIAVWGDKIDEMTLAVGQQFAADVAVESREYNGRWYTEVKVIKLLPVEQYAAASPAYDAPPFPDEGMYPF